MGYHGDNFLKLYHNDRIAAVYEFLLENNTVASDLETVKNFIEKRKEVKVNRPTVDPNPRAAKANGDEPRALHM